MEHDDFCAVYGEMHILLSHQLSTHTLSINTALESPKMARTADAARRLSNHLRKVNTDLPTSRLHFWMASRLVKISCHASPRVCFVCALQYHTLYLHWMKIALMICCTITLVWIEIWGPNKASFRPPCQSDLA